MSNLRRNDSWHEYTMHQGAYVQVAKLLRSGEGFKIEARGHSSEGWAAYLIDRQGIALQVSPIFRPEFGDTLRDLKDAAWRMYQTDVRHRRGSFLM